MEQSLKHESPGDVSKRDGGGPEERNGGLHPLYLIPGFFVRRARSGGRGLEHMLGSRGLDQALQKRHSLQPEER